MTVNPGLVSIAPYQSKSVIPDRLDVGQLEVTAFCEADGALVTLAVRAGTESSQ